MNVFIFGQRSFGLEVLKAVCATRHKVVGVAVAPQRVKKDRMVGFALLKGIPILGDMENFRADDFPDGVDLVVSAHSHWIVSDAVLARSRHGGIGYHPSLLPRHRGQDAVRWAYHMRDPVTGGTIYRLAPKCDGGDVLLQRWRFVDYTKTYHDLWRELFPEGVRLVVEAIEMIADGRDVGRWTPQDERFATWEPSWERPRLRRNDLIRLA